MYTREFPAFNVAATGASNTTTASTSAGGTIPAMSDGNVPRFVRVTANGVCYVRLRTGSTTAVTTDMMLQAGDDAILKTNGATHYAVIDNGTSVRFNITPLEDS